MFGYIGETAALLGSCFWSAGSTFFTFSVRRIGVFQLNVVRVTAALFMITAVMFAMTGSFYPKGAPMECWMWLAASSVVGIVVGDMFYFAALKSLGARNTMLLYSISPPVAAFCEWILLKNAMSVYALLGMTVTLFGVGLAITEKTGASARLEAGAKKNGFNLKEKINISPKGAALALSAAFCQGVGLVFSKMGVGGKVAVSPVEGTFIRMLVAAVIFLAAFVIMRMSVRKLLADRRGVALGLGGAFFGPFLGITMSLFAVKYTHAGVAMTILSTTPITILPFSVVVFKEKPSYKSVIGAALAVIGVSLLFVK